MTSRPHLPLLMLTALLAVLPTVPVQPAAASEAVPKQVHLLVESERLVASNAKFSRFDELKLNGGERILEQAEGEAVIVVVTNQRLIAYGVRSGWRPTRTKAAERVEKITAEDFAALIVTNQRLLNFNGETGVWGERKRGVGE